MSFVRCLTLTMQFPRPDAAGSAPSLSRPDVIVQVIQCFHVKCLVLSDVGLVEKEAFCVASASVGSSSAMFRSWDIASD